MQTGLLFKTYLIFSLEIFLIYAAVYAYIIGCIRLTSADKQENKLLLNNLRIDQNGNK